jgi:hypothetical protein
MATFSHLHSSALDQELGTDDSTQLFTSARRQNAINAGVLAFADLTECYRRESTITCSNGIREYNLLSTVNVRDGDYLRLAKQRPEWTLTDSNSNLRTVSGEDFPRREVEWLNQFEPGWRDSTGDTPQCYYERMDGGRRLIGLSPPPRIGSSETAILRLPFVARPPVMTASTDVPFTSSQGTRTDLEPYHHAFAHYGASELEKLRKDDHAVLTQMQIFLAYVQRFLDGLKPKGGHQVKHARSYFGESRQGRYSVSGIKAWPW